MAHTRASKSSADALDEALAAALAQALSAHPHGGLKLTKRERLKRHRDAIVALRAKRWSWEQIAATLASAGLEINPRTLRTEMTAPKRSRQRRALRPPGDDPVTGADDDHASTNRWTPPAAAAEANGQNAFAAAPMSSADAPTSGQRDQPPPERRPTESGFFTIDLEDN